MKDRIYICHTYYHVYVTFLKELKLRAEADPAKKAGAATLVLSKMSNNFENLKSRVESTGPVSYTHLTLPTTDWFIPSI